MKTNPTFFFCALKLVDEPDDAGDDFSSATVRHQFDRKAFNALKQNFTVVKTRSFISKDLVLALLHPDPGQRLPLQTAYARFKVELARRQSRRRRR